MKPSPANQETELQTENADFVWKSAKISKAFKAAAKTFVKKGSAGYEIWAASRDWFLEQWGRDTFIALPGLLLTTKRYKEAKSIFTQFAEHERGGLIPNRIIGEYVQYNTVDASMWYLQALKKYLEVSGDRKFVESLLPTVQNIIEGYINGTSYERNNREMRIYMDSDGLIVSPSQATWMDADPSGSGAAAVTPRNGKAVEINALWYANLRWAADLLGDAALSTLADKVKKSFNSRFWNGEENCLIDVVDGDPHSGALRPNQIFAVSHGLDLLSKTRQKQVFDAVTKDLLTPAGLHSLSPRDSHYIGEYDTHAPMHVKDLAYHQGTVWVWLVGPYCDALIKIWSTKGTPTAKIREKIREILTPLVRFCLESEFQSLPEVFSGYEPHIPGGTTSQAWSVAEVFRVMKEQRLI